MKSYSSKKRVHAHARQRMSRKKPEGRGGHTDPRPGSILETKPEESAPSTRKENLLKVVTEIKTQLENDAKNVGIQAARLMLVEDFLRIWADADKKPTVEVLPYTT